MLAFSPANGDNTIRGRDNRWNCLKHFRDEKYLFACFQSHPAIVQKYCHVLLLLLLLLMRLSPTKRQCYCIMHVCGRAYVCFNNTQGFHFCVCVGVEKISQGAICLRALGRDLCSGVV